MKEKGGSNTFFYSPENIVPIRSLVLRAKCIVEGLIAGYHRSPYHGFSSEFLEYRPYRFGEPARCIDWRKYAKTERTVVRLFEDETNLYARILLDKSASMQFYSSGSMSKFDYARTLAAALAQILIRQRDAVGIEIFDENIKTSIPPRSTNIQLNTILAELEHIVPEKHTNCGSVINTIARKVKKRGLCIIISDFFDTPESIIKSLRHLRFKRQEIIILWILDPLELDFSKDSKLKIKDVETQEELILDGNTASHFYEIGFKSHRKKIEDACRELMVDCSIVTTDAPFQKALIQILEKRRKMF
jgi:uncharacterized protein (DUF58 family)